MNYSFTSCEKPTDNILTTHHHPMCVVCERLKVKLSAARHNISGNFKMPKCKATKILDFFALIFSTTQLPRVYRGSVG